MREMLRDFGYALRQLRRSPGFALTAVLTLSLTVGLAATVFSVFDALLVRPLPYGEPERIVSNHSFADKFSNQPASLPELKFWREHNSTYAAMAGSTVDEVNLLGPEGPSVVHAVNASEDFSRYSASPPCWAAASDGKMAPVLTSRCSATGSGAITSARSGACWARKSTSTPGL